MNLMMHLPIAKVLQDSLTSRNLKGKVLFNVYFSRVYRPLLPIQGRSKVHLRNAFYCDIPMVGTVCDNSANIRLFLTTINISFCLQRPRVLPKAQAFYVSWNVLFPGCWISCTMVSKYFKVD